MAQEITNTEPLKDGKVKPKDQVTVYATNKAKFYTEGEKITIHSALAEKLIKKGSVTKTKLAGKKAD